MSYVNFRITNRTYVYYHDLQKKKSKTHFSPTSPIQLFRMFIKDEKRMKKINASFNAKCFKGVDEPCRNCQTLMNKCQTYTISTKISSYKAFEGIYN